VHKRYDTYEFAVIALICYNLMASKWVPWLHVTQATYLSISSFFHFILLKLQARDRQTDR